MYNNTKNVQNQSLPSSCNKVRRQNSGSNSPEFEFWMVRNPSCPKPNIVSADKLFVNGVLLPLDHMDSPDPNPQHAETRPEPDTDLSPSSITAESSSLFSTSKRWRDIFKKSEKKSTREDKENNNKNKNKKKRDKKSHVGLANTTATAELNINIWPFSRSRSAGNNTARPRLATSRKVSSAPCSRSNSAGESKSRDWPSSPGRVGVHLGRSSPVWQVRRANGIRNSSSGSESAGCVKKDGKTAAKVLNLKVPICVGYRHSLSCRSDENSSLGGTKGGGGGCSGGTKGGGAARTSGGSDLFDIRSLFSKKVVY